ncbi:MAG: lipopolysaccharide heptosyltransferase I [Acidiferrobacteraceae bacterium]
MNPDRPRILIVKTSSMGDIVHSFPMVTDLRRHRPHAEIDWLAEESFAALPLLHPGVQQVLPVALRRWRHAVWSVSTWREWRLFWRRLRAEHYDVVLDNQGLLKSALLARGARGPVWGADRHSAREGLAAWLYHRRVPMRWQQHAIARNRELAARLFGYPVPTDPPDYGLPAADTVNPGLVLCLHATSRTTKEWPEASWRTLLVALADRGFVAHLPYARPGSADERRARALAAAVPGAQVLTPRPLGALAPLLSSAALVVGVDTGLLHLAAAYGRPTVAIYVDSDPRLNGVCAGMGGVAVNVGRGDGAPSPGTVLDAIRSLPDTTPCP